MRKVDTIGQDTLFGKKIISTISYNEQEIIRDILHLHCNDMGIEVDTCYSKGNFYKNGLQQPKYKFDINPQSDDVIKSDCRELPLDNNTVNNIMYDPPFLMGGENYGDNKEGSSIIMKRFEGFKDWGELRNLYSLSLKEFYRVLKPNGVLIFKCQDTVSGGKNYFTHCWVMNEAVKYGFYPKDLFILLTKTRLTDNRIQQHARKFHCYYFVFEKRQCPIDYNLK